MREKVFYIDKKLNYWGGTLRNNTNYDIFCGSLAKQPSFYEPATSGVVHQSNMASKSALAPKLYKRFLQVCEQWPVDQNRLGRDLGEHLNRNLVPRIKNAQIDVS